MQFYSGLALKRVEADQLLFYIEIPAPGCKMTRGSDQAIATVLPLMAVANLISAKPPKRSLLKTRINLLFL